MIDDLACLCANCGTIAPASAFASVRRADNGSGWIPDPDCTYDPLLRCPACAYVHTDDDAGPGMYEGTPESMEAQRTDLLAEAREPYGGNWREWWDEVWARRADALIEERAALAGMVDLYRCPGVGNAARDGKVIVEAGASPADDALIAALAVLGAS